MKQLKYITLKRLMTWKPCYDEDEILELSGGRRRMTPLEIAGADNISIDDRLWVLLRPEIIPERTLHTLACDWASDVLPIFERMYPDDKRPRQVIEIKRAWIEGKATDEELYAARAAARDAACDAAWAAAWDASWAAWAAGDAAKKKQMNDVISILKRG